MSELAANLVDSIKSIVAEHYRQNSAPLLLSELGSLLRKQSLWQDAGTGGKSLRQFIESLQDPDLSILRDKKSPSYIAVVTQPQRAVVAQWIERRSQAVAEIPDLDALPRCVLLAFCVHLDQGTSVYLRRVPPFRFETHVPEGSEQDFFVIVEDRYRRPGLRVSTPSELTASDRIDLQGRIAAWSRDKNVPIESFYRQKSPRHANALERLIAAQPPGIAEKMVIPGDIALLLSSKTSEQ